MAQNYPVYVVLTGTTLAALGATITVFIVQGGTPTVGNPGAPVIAGALNTKDYQWSPAAPDPANLAVTQTNTSIPGNVYAVGSGSGNGTYSTAAAAQAAANSYCTSIAASRDQAASLAQYKTGNGANALSNPTVELGPL